MATEEKVPSVREQIPTAEFIEDLPTYMSKEGTAEAEAPEALEAVLSRLRFRRGLLTALTAMLRPNAKAAELARKMLAFATAQANT